MKELRCISCDIEAYFFKKLRGLLIYYAHTMRIKKYISLLVFLVLLDKKVVGSITGHFRLDYLIKTLIVSVSQKYFIFSELFSDLLYTNYSLLDPLLQSPTHRGTSTMGPRHIGTSLGHLL